MPRVTIGRRTKMDEVARKIYRHVKSEYPLSKLVSVMGYSPATHTNRLRSPETFTLAQLRTLYSISDVTDEEFMEMIREAKDARHSRFI